MRSAMPVLLETDSPELARNLCSQGFEERAHREVSHQRHYAAKSPEGTAKGGRCALQQPGAGGTICAAGARPRGELCVLGVGPSCIPGPEEKKITTSCSVSPTPSTDKS